PAGIAGAIRADVEVGCHAGDIRNIAQRGRTLVARIDERHLVARDRLLVRGRAATTAGPARFGLPAAAGAVGDQRGAAHRGDVGIIGGPHAAELEAIAIVAGGIEEGLALRLELLEDRIDRAGIDRPAPR